MRKPAIARRTYNVRRVTRERRHRLGSTLTAAKGQADDDTDHPAADTLAMAAEDDGALSPELEAKLLRALREDWRGLNYQNFSDVMRTPVFKLSDADNNLACWRSTDRTIDISRQLVRNHPWGVVVEVLKHEMAHQFVDEVLKRQDEPAHGPSFRTVCKERGIDPDPVGAPAAPTEGDTRVAARVAKLLALASSANQHEAETAMIAARRLMLQYNVEAIEARRPRSYTFRNLGPPARRLNEHRRWLAHLLTDQFFVEGLWVDIYLPDKGHRAQVFEICGTPANLEIAEYAHAFVLTSTERLWREAKKAGASGRRRHEFMAGVVRGFHRKLKAQAAPRPNDGEHALVVTKDQQLTNYLRRRWPRIQTVRRGGQRRTGAFDAGQRAGQSITLHRAVTDEGGNRGRTLPAKTPRRG